MYRMLWLWCVLVFAPPVFALGIDKVVEGEYIVVLKKTKSMQTFDVKAYGEVVKQFKTINGMLLKMDESQLESLKKDPNVAYVEQNKVMHTWGTQTNPPWGLDRIDSRKGLDSRYDYDQTGSGVNVYVVDTGVRTTHTEFTGRVGQGFSAVNDSQGTNDCNGHGTHVSATILGKTYGVAKGAKIFPVRVLDCQGSGTLDDVIEGIEWVGNNAKKPSVANMSLGGSKAQSIDDAVKAAISKGVAFVVAAGNDSADACSYSPASEPTAITVAATDRSDNAASFTNYGRCVDVYAPGVDILSAGITSDTATDTMSGTSMASPHTAGVAALYLAKEPNLTPSQVEAKFKSLATPNVVKGSKSGTPNLLVYTNPTGTTPPDDPNPPTPPTPPDPGNPDKTPPPECSGRPCYSANGALRSGESHTHPPQPISVSYPRQLVAVVKATSDLDIYLFVMINGQWREVARATGGGSQERLAFYPQVRGLYAWVVAPKQTGGKYNMWIAY